MNAEDRELLDQLREACDVDDMTTANRHAPRRQQIWLSYPSSCLIFAFVAVSVVKWRGEWGQSWPGPTPGWYA